MASSEDAVLSFDYRGNFSQSVNSVCASRLLPLAVHITSSTLKSKYMRFGTK